MALIADLIQSKETQKHKPQKIKAYLGLYYEEKVQPTIEGTLEVGNCDAMTAMTLGGTQAEKPPPKLAIIMNKMQEIFRNELAKMMAKVEECWKEMVAEKEYKDDLKMRDK